MPRSTKIGLAVVPDAEGALGADRDFVKVGFHGRELKVGREEQYDDQRLYQRQQNLGKAEFVDFAF
ncbi:hypothetical protein GCM10011383_23630 [Hymenobacter cavernae]|uniref:Uncharacterized protein n=1 Tax=Hymenobacter cavernae TaxID=2044852 RepID=A0ABQ1UAC2_9BACT|nr:hypothetical protein GCM10011383_23630 [Hymenobacter cavernae]